MTSKTLDEAVWGLRYYPLDNINSHSSAVLEELSNTGVNLGRKLARRYSFVKSKLVYELSDDLSQVTIKIKYGLGGETKLLTTVRPVYLENSNTPCMNQFFLISDTEATLSTLEPLVNERFETEGFMFDESIRYKQISKILKSQNQKYRFQLPIKINTISLYADLKLNFLLDTIEFNDAIGTLKNTINEKKPEDQKYLSATSLLNVITTIPPNNPIIALSYRQHLDGVELPKEEE